MDCGEAWMTPIKNNDVISLEIDDLAYGGCGVGRHDDFVVFVEKALPGELIHARIRKKKSNHAHAVIESVERPSPERIMNPRCELFGRCGGCCLQHFPYPRQAEWKKKQVVDTLKHLGGHDGLNIAPIIPSPDPWHYRNKMEYSFSENDSAEVILGFHSPGRFDHLLEVEKCHIHPVPFDTILEVLTCHARKHHLRAYSKKKHQGFLRHAVMRYSHTDQESILILLTHQGELKHADELNGELNRRVKGFKGWIWGIHTGIADVARMETQAGSWGEPELYEEVNGLRFRISPQAFFQTNTEAARILYRKVHEIARINRTSCVLDAYCGLGVIGLHCAGQAESVFGVESVTSAIWDARENARQNNIHNAVFIAQALPAGLDLAVQAARRPFTHVIIDPPRGGMDKRSLKGLISLMAPVFVYVSCNPATLARDLVTITESGYRIEEVQPIDMFPHTYHIEIIVRLVLNPGN
jgi:23S rRNA (uracil1939-C5)-methyltransferase